MNHNRNVLIVSDDSVTKGEASQQGGMDLIFLQKPFPPEQAL